VNRGDEPAQPVFNNHQDFGLTIREYYAGIALQALLARGFISAQVGYGHDRREVSIYQAAREHADKLIETLQRNKG
jgi:hypothetical protein